MTLCDTRPQIEGIDRIRDLNSATNYWGWVQCGDIGKLYLGGNDDNIALRFHHGYTYEPVSLNLWRQRCADGLAVDVGSHTGIYSLAAWKSGARSVLSLEPFYANAARCQFNLRGNGWSPKNLVYAAASDRDGIANLVTSHVAVDNGLCTGASRLFDTFTGTSPVFPVATYRLDGLIPADYWRDIHIIKLDVEYHLCAALRGAQQILATARPDLLFESFEPDIASLLTPHGYLFWHIDETRGLRHVDTIEAQPKDGHRNYFASVRSVQSDWLA